MFKLFGKKQEPQEEVREAALSRHPKAAALGAQFWQEEFDILAITGANGFGGEMCIRDRNRGNHGLWPQDMAGRKGEPS